MDRRKQTSTAFSIFCYTLLFCIVLALLLSFVPQANAEKYNRVKHFGGWIDADGDCQNTRAEVLIEESLVHVTLSDDGCRVLTGLWHCEFTGDYYSQASDVDIDHRVPLKEVWLSGADEWTKEQRIAYANDLDNPDHLLAVDDSSNQSKGAKDPAGWMPEVDKAGYIEKWIAVKEMYGLTFDAKEVMAIVYESTKGE